MYLQLQDQVDYLERQTAEVVERNQEEEHRLRREKGLLVSSCSYRRYTFIFSVLYAVFYAIHYVDPFSDSGLPFSIFLSLSLSLSLSVSLSNSLCLFFSPSLSLLGRAESSLNAKISQFDEDMNSRQTSLEELKISYAQESDEFALLKGTYCVGLTMAVITLSPHLSFPIS